MCIHTPRHGQHNMFYRSMYGYSNEVSIFHCHMDMLPYLNATARIYEACASVEDLWITMLRVMGGVSLAGRSNLSEVLRRHEHALPEWLLCSSELGSRLVVDNNCDVHITEDPPLDDPDNSTEEKKKLSEYTKRMKLRKSQFDQFFMKGSVEAAQHNKAFLMSDPPLPSMLLAMLSTAELISLSRVCKELHVASYELVRREEAAWRFQTPLAIALSNYQPFQQCVPESGTVEVARRGGRQDSPTFEDRRKMRAMSLLCDIPEMVSSLYCGSSFNEHRGLVTDRKRSQKAEHIISNVMKKTKAKEIEVNLPKRDNDPMFTCNLYITPPAEAHTLVNYLVEVLKNTGGYVYTEEEEEEDQDKYLSSYILSRTPHTNKDRLRKLLIMARRAAEEREALCVLYYVI